MKKLLVMIAMFGVIGDILLHPCDKELSGKIFTNWNFNDVYWLSLTSKTICNSSFYNETPNSAIFPSTMTGVTFSGCNLDNVIIPEGNTLINCSNKSFKVQNDREDWIIDSKTLSPIEPLNKESFESLEISTDPINIPAEPLKDPITSSKKGLKHNLEIINSLQKQITELENFNYLLSSGMGNQ